MPKQGTIVLIPFPFTDLSEAKVRPALVVSSFKNSEDIIVLFISSKKEKSNKYDIEILANKENGLKINSKVKCSKIATLDKKILIGEIGRLDTKDFAKIKVTLKKIFN